MNAPVQADLFRVPAPPPTMVALGMGVDSVSMIIEMHALGMPIDQVLFADTGSEKPETYEYEAMFSKWMRDRGIPYERVVYTPQRFLNGPKYDSLETNCYTNATLPSIAMGRHSCSLKWKVAPQHKWTQQWEPAVACWAAGGRVRKAIGYDAGPADSRRHAHQEGMDNELYDLFFPLREWGWEREACEDRIRREGLPVPIKSACFFCSASKPWEIDRLGKVHLRRIVLMEARAKPRLRNIDGLWRKPVKGMRGATPKPGSMTEYIRMKGLLDEAEIDRIWNDAPKALVTWKELQAEKPLAERPALREWIEFFDRNAGLFAGDGARDLYGNPGYDLLRERLEDGRPYYLEENTGS